MPHTPYFYCNEPHTHTYNTSQVYTQHSISFNMLCHPYDINACTHTTAICIMVQYVFNIYGDAN